MIFVKELDVYLRTFFYWINFNFYSQNFNLFEEVKAWKRFLDNNQGALREIEESAGAFGFKHDVSRGRGMAGEKEIRTQRMNFFLPFDGLRIYPRLLYSEGYLPKPSNFEKHRYYFTYYPKVLMPIFKKTEKKTWEALLSHHWTVGTHRHIKKTKEHLIAYNVSVPVNLATIVEEELHTLGKKVHGKTTREDILNMIRTRDPNLEKEIELNLNHILSAEEKRFRDFGDLIREEKSPEMRKLETFCDLFEKNNRNVKRRITKYKLEDVRAHYHHSIFHLHSNCRRWTSLTLYMTG